MTDEREMRDPALDAAWRAQVRDEPSPALDQRVLAAAHRAVQSAPHEAGRSSSRWRAWMPLAAAAALGVIAFGVVELMPRDDSNGSAVVSDVPAAPPRKDAASAPPMSAPVEQSEPTISPAEQAARSTAPLAARSEARMSAPAAQSEPSAPAPAARPEPPVAAPAPASPAQPVRPDSARKSVASNASRALEAEAPRDATDVLRQRRETAAALEKRGDATMDESRPFPGAPARAKVAAPLANEDNMAAPAAAPPPPAPMMRPQSSLAAADAHARTADDFIRDIERLRGEGRDADAALALSAFRAAYRDADTRLPAALREWARSVPRP